METLSHSIVNNRKMRNFLAGSMLALCSVLNTSCSSDRTKYVVQDGDVVSTILVKHGFSPTKKNIHHFCEVNDIDPSTYIIHLGDEVFFDDDLDRSSVGNVDVKDDDHRESNASLSNDMESYRGHYSVYSSLRAMKNGNNYFARKLSRDKVTASKLKKHFRQGHKICVPEPMENRDNPSLSVEDITRPDRLLDHTLQGKRFVLDPGHGGLDIGSVAMPKFGTEKDHPDEYMVVYESPVVMDFTYRVAKLIRAHGGEIMLTHHYNKRGIVDQSDLPPASRSFDNDGKEVFQDIFADTHSDDGEVIRAGGRCLRKRVSLANAGGDFDAFISFHSDVATSGHDDKTLEILYNDHFPSSQSLAHDLLENGFCYEYQGKKSEAVDYGTKVRNKLCVLKNKKGPSILVELANMNCDEQAYFLRKPENRQQLAESFVKSLLATYAQ